MTLIWFVFPEKCQFIFFIYLSLFFLCFIINLWVLDLFLTKISSFGRNKDNTIEQWRSQEFTSGCARHYFLIFGWAQTQKFEDSPMNLHLFKRFSKFLGGPVPKRPVFWLLYCHWIKLLHIYYHSVILI